MEVFFIEIMEKQKCESRTLYNTLPVSKDKP